MSIHACLDYQNRAKQKIPGMSQLLSKRPDMFSLGVWPGYYAKAKGVHVWDLDGNEYIDMSISGIGANVLGYADEDVNAAVIQAVNNGSSSSLNPFEEVELAELLCELHPWAQKCRFTRGGAEAMAVAVRIARAFTGRDIVAICGYHGWHDWYLAANLSSEEALQEHLLPGLSPIGVPRALKGTIFTFPYNHSEGLQRLVDEYGKQLAAVVIEPIRNIQPAPDFLSAVQNLAHQAGAVLIADEISSGFRLNSGGAHGIYNLEPDIAVFSKAIGNGFPIAAVIGRSAVMDAAQKSFISSTMWSERIGPVAALATIRKHRQHHVGQHLQRIGQLVQEGWQGLATRHDISIKIEGITPLSHFKFEHPKSLAQKAYFIQEMLKKGFLASTTFYPMWAHTPEHVEQYLNAADQVFAQIRRHLQDDTLEAHLQGQPSAAGFKRIT